MSGIYCNDFVGGIAVNVSDRSSNDWAAKSMIETQRGNCHLVEDEAIGMPFLKVGKSILVFAPK